MTDYNRAPRIASNKPVIPRKCTVCGHNFSSKYPRACPECSGWTQSYREIRQQSIKEK